MSSSKESPIRLIQVAGWLGSGKTTLVIALGKGLANQGAKVAIIVNEIGAVPVDGRIVEEYGLAVRDIGGGCICCQASGSIVRTVKALAEGSKPDVIIIEPTGLAVPGSISEMMRTGIEGITISKGPTIVLLDTSRIEKLLGYESLRRLVTAQLADADIIALSKIDFVEDKKLKEAVISAQEINATARIVFLSSLRGDGVKELIEASGDFKNDYSS